MQRHTKIYLKYFDYGEQDVILCECCHVKAVDIHHIQGRLGSQANTIKNLMALCRKCHDKAHEEKLSKSDLQYIHNNVLANNSKQFVK